MEIYKDAAAFAHHLNGPMFTAFRNASIAHFVEDSADPGWPDADTEFLQRQSAFIRPQA